MATATELYYYDANGNRQGPMTMGQLRSLVERGELFPGTTVELPDGKRFEAKQIRGLFPETPIAIPYDIPDRVAPEKAAGNDSWLNELSRRIEEGTTEQPSQVANKDSDVYGVSTTPPPRVWPPEGSSRSPREDSLPKADTKNKVSLDKAPPQEENPFEPNNPSDDESPFDRSDTPSQETVDQPRHIEKLNVYIAWWLVSFVLFAFTAFATFLFVINCLLPFPKWLSFFHCLVVAAVLLFVSCAGLILPTMIWFRHRRELPPLIPNVKKIFQLLFEPLNAWFPKSD